MNKIPVKHRGKQPKIHSSKLTSPHGFGPYHNKQYALQVEDIQEMKFTDKDPGPCYMNDNKRLERRYDKNSGKTSLRDVVKADLNTALKEK